MARSTSSIRPLAVKRNVRDFRQVIAAGGALTIILAWLLFGETGLFAWNDYSRTLNARRTELSELRTEQAALVNRQRLLDPRHVDPDLADELVREEMNLLHPDDIVVPLR
jgi:cell division protein FtsB